VTFCAIVVAAGSGTRFGAPKHSALLDGRPLWEHGRSTLLQAGATSVVVVGDVEGGVRGGSRRRDSVAAGLAALASDCPYVLVHDAARPLATVSLARAVADRIEMGDVDAVVPVLAVTDAIKRVDSQGIASAVDRTDLVAVQTPQGFVVSTLQAAHAEVDGDAADDAELVERWGGRVGTVPGERTNLKITYPSDLVTAGSLLETL